MSLGTFEKAKGNDCYVRQVLRQIMRKLNARNQSETLRELSVKMKIMFIRNLSKHSIRPGSFVYISWCFEQEYATLKICTDYETIVALGLIFFNIRQEGCIIASF